MRSQIKNKIAPPVPAHAKNFQQKGSSGVNSKSRNQVDFKQVLLNSNRAVKEKRAAESKGDLSGAKSYEDFLDTLNRQTSQERLPKNSLDKNDFLNLFITQIQNQDPLNPKDGTEMASQLAQFNSLEQMININNSLEQLGQKTDQGQNINYINYLDKEVHVNNGKIALNDHKITDSRYVIKTPLNSTQLTVRDSLGSIVAKLDMGPKKPGEYQISWDGMNEKGENVPDGVYKFSLFGIGSDNTEVDIPVTSKLKITGINLKDKNSSFFTDAGKIGFDEIEEIGSKDFSQEKLLISKPVKEPDANLNKIISKIDNNLQAQKNTSPKSETVATPVTPIKSLETSEKPIAEGAKNDPTIKVSENKNKTPKNDKHAAFYPELSNPFATISHYDDKLSSTKSETSGNHVNTKS